VLLAPSTYSLQSVRVVSAVDLAVARRHSASILLCTNFSPRSHVKFRR